MFHPRRVRSSAGAVAMLALAACAAPDAITAPRGPSLRTVSRAVVPTDNWFEEAGKVTVCNFNEPNGYIASATGGNLLASSFSLGIEECAVVWEATSSSAEQVTVTARTDLGVRPFRIAIINSLTGGGDLFSPVVSATVGVNDVQGSSLWFKNERFDVPPPPPPPALKGCTPGYWKQKQHFDSWPAPYTPSTPFSAVFANAFPGKTLVQVASAGGGGLNALGRHTVAALLSSGSVNYAYSTAQVISAFNAAYASGNYEAQHLLFAANNELGCPLN